MALKKSLAVLITAYELISPVSVCAAGGDTDSSMCSDCHGENGNSQDPTRPNLAGQSPEYIFDQLQAFKAGNRTNSVMNNIASGLSDSDMRNLGAFYSRQSPSTSYGNSELVSQGKTKYAVCWGCHGISAEGSEGYPRLAGQNPAYVVAQLNNFRTGSRRNPAMTSILSSMNEDDFNAIAAYLASLKID